MTPEQIRLVQKSYEKVRPMAEQAAEMFYNRLFNMNPALRPLFKGDMQRQGQMLISAIGLAVNGLDRPETVEPAVQALGVRHAGYGVVAQNYPMFGAALIWTLEQVLGDDFTPETRAAWGEAYGLLSALMKAAAAHR